MTAQRADDAPRPGHLIVVEGIDGAGKSTVCRLLAGQLPGVVYLTNKTRCDHPPWARRMMTELAGVIWPPTDTDFDHLLPASFWLHLQAAWYALLSRTVIAPQLAAGLTLLVDGWYYKLVAKLALRGFGPGQLEAAFADAAVPDEVVLLLVEPATVWERGRDFRLTELGLHHPDEYPRLGRDSFVHYQGRIAAELRGLAARDGWAVVPVDADAKPAQTAADLLDALTSRPGPSR
jgi:thymidylate kinase